MNSSAPTRTPPTEDQPTAAVNTGANTGINTESALEPLRLLAGGNAFERRLLESAGVDRISEASLEHLARALNVPSASASTALREGTVQAVRLGKYGSLVGLGALGLVAALAAFPWLAPAASEPTSATVLSGPAPITITEHETLTPSSSEVEVAPMGPVAGSRWTSAPSPQVELPPPAAKARAGAGASRLPAQVSTSKVHAEPTAAVRSSGLRAELRALEATQSALRAGRAEEAVRALDDYARRFPRGELALEAELLRIDLLLARGQERRAHAQARQLLARPDAARYRERLEALAGDGASDSTLAPRSGVNSPRPHIDERR